MTEQTFASIWELADAWTAQAGPHQCSCWQADYVPGQGWKQTGCYKKPVLMAGVIRQCDCVPDAVTTAYHCEECHAKWSAEDALTCRVCGELILMTEAVRI